VVEARDQLFGERLLSWALINTGDLMVAAQHAAQSGGGLADSIISLGLLPEADTYAALARATEMPLVDLRLVTPDALALRLVPERVARRHVILPVSQDNRTLTYAVARAYDNEAERDVRFAAGRDPLPVLAPRSQIAAAIDRHYANAGQVELLVARIPSQAAVEMFDPSSTLGGDDVAPAIQLCNHILADAVKAKASDVHIEPSASGATVRYRRFGILEPVLTLPKEAVRAVINRFKIMARADITVTHRPLDGAFHLRINGGPVDVRLSTLPTMHGEKVVMRVIDSVNEFVALDRLGYDATTLERFAHALDRPDGLVLVTGPTGSGKTTTLYAALNHLRTGRTNIVTVEDPVERLIEGVSQIQVNNLGGATFATVLRSVLRQDPNIIMVGEIRDSEVAQIVGQAAYTGHLVLSSLHTSDTASAIVRLLNLGLEPFKIAESLSAIVAQRLVRKVCPHCRVLYDEHEARRLGRLQGVSSVPAAAGRGCEQCRYTGYVERVAVAELLAPDEQLREVIRAGASAGTLRAAMRAGGWRSMRETAVALVAGGTTSIEEINRVLADDRVPAATARQKQRVAIVDDDRVTRMLVKLLLESDAYDVLEGENGYQAIDLARRERPDLLLVDLLMPEMDGYQAIAEIRKDLSLVSLPVIVLTTDSSSGAEQRVLELGTDDYLVKPFEADVLLSRVRAGIERVNQLAA
jgi:type IV pilus assembly protein PilB